MADQDGAASASPPPTPAHLRPPTPPLPSWLTATDGGSPLFEGSDAETASALSPSTPRASLCTPRPRPSLSPPLAISREGTGGDTESSASPSTPMIKEGTSLSRRGGAGVQRVPFAQNRKLSSAAWSVAMVPSIGTFEQFRGVCRHCLSPRSSDFSTQISHASRRRGGELAAGLRPALGDVGGPPAGRHEGSGSIAQSSARKRRSFRTGASAACE